MVLFLSDWMCLEVEDDLWHSDCDTPSANNLSLFEKNVTSSIL